MENETNYPIRNQEGYLDPTAHEALGGIQRESAETNIRFHRLVKTVLNMIDIAGFQLENRLELRDRKTGKRYW